MKKIWLLTTLIFGSLLLVGCNKPNNLENLEVSEKPEISTENKAIQTSEEDSTLADLPDTVTANTNNYFVADITLNDGNKMPVLWIWTFQLSNEQAENSVYRALKYGFRLIDTARIYGNEVWVWRWIQRAIDEWIVKREDIFVTTKMWTSDYDNPKEAIEWSLQRLWLDYIDLMILHHSQTSNDVVAYKWIEEAVNEWKLKSIWLSNYYDGEDFDRVVNATTIKPAILQNETHIYHQSRDMANYISKYWTVIESWYPLWWRWHTQELFNDEVIKSLAEKYNKSSAQILIRWHLQMWYIAIPWSSNESHIKENYDVFDFELTDEEMESIKALDKEERNSTY